MDASTISSIIIAIIAALVSILSVLFSYFTARAAESRSERAKLDRQLKKYSQPLLIAAFDLQARLYEILELPISDLALKSPEGIEDLWVFTCFRLARFLAAAWILREATHFLSMQTTPQESWWGWWRSWFANVALGGGKSRNVYHVKNAAPTQRRIITDEERVDGPQRVSTKRAPPASVEIDTSASKIRDLLYKIDDELDRRRDEHGQNYGIFPGARLLVAERMVVEVDGADEDDEKGDELKAKNWDAFRKEWETEFMEPCSFFLKWIDAFIEQRQKGELDKGIPGKVRRKDDHLRCLQHLLVDVVRYCDLRGLYDSGGAGEYILCQKSLDCDCSTCAPHLTITDRNQSREEDAEMERIRSPLQIGYRERIKRNTEQGFSNCK